MTQMRSHATAAARLLGGLSNANRLQILCALSETELAVGEINARIPSLSQSALSQHLGILREQGLVVSRRDSQSVYYRLCAGPALEIIQVLHEHFCKPGKGRRS